MTNHPAAQAGTGKESNHTFKDATMALRQTPSNRSTPLHIGHIPQALRLQRGQVLCCAGGCLWITSDELADRGRDSDVVLESGQSFVVPRAGTYFAGAPLGSGVLSVSCAGAPALTLAEAAC